MVGTMNASFLLLALLMGTLQVVEASPTKAMAAETQSVPATQGEITVSASFADKQSVPSTESIELILSRPLGELDGKVAVLIGTTDVTSLFTKDKLRLRYDAHLWPLPVGESPVTVYLIGKDDEWKEVAEFKLRVSANREARAENIFQDLAEVQSPVARFLKAKFAIPFGPNFVGETETDLVQTNPQSPTVSQSKSNKSRKMTFLPSLTFTIKSQPAQSTFPDSDRPARATFTDLTMQATLKNDAALGIFKSQSSFDFAGSSFEQEALRFGTLGNNAPKVDLSSYLIQFQTGRVKYQIGHFSYGTQRQLINNFSSRGLTVTVPVSKRFDISLAAMNGTQIVGYENFFGIKKRRHEMLSGTLGIELFPKRPGGLRLEVGILSAYFQPLSGFNRGVVTDTQRSRGIALRLLASDKAGRLHFEGGFTRSFFVSPNDNTLSQGATLVPLPALSRNAHYLEASYDILRNFSLNKTKKANLSVAFREENVAPLFRSLGASTQADKIQYEFSVNGSVNEISAQFSHSNFHDNLRNIPSILRSLNGSTHISLAAPASALLNRTKSSPWLPRLGYSFDRVHSFGAAIPVNGGFEVDLSSIPNLFGTNQTFSADWQVKKFTVGYNLNHSFQNNEQTGRERADQGVLVNTGRFGIAATSKLNLNIDLSAESSANKETGRIDRTERLGPGMTWLATKHMSFSANLANTIAGDAARTSHSRNTEFDCAWTYKFEHGKEGFRKVAGQFFIRYANHYSHSLDHLFVIDSLRKNQTLTANLGITLF